MKSRFSTFLKDDRGAVTVDWTVLSAAVVSMSLATVGVLSGGIQSMVSRLDAELRSQQMSDNFVQFTSAHFEPLYEGDQITAATAEELFYAANALMNQEIIDALNYGIQALENGELTPQDIGTLVALASVADQRNLISDQILDYYFGFDGSYARIDDAL
jgi:Flp pilus assembly pilin Flp